MDGVPSHQDMHASRLDISSVVRISSRQFIESSRRHRRDQDSDKQRDISIPILDREAISTISNKLKSAVSAEELTQLKNALLEDTTNIEVVLSCNGALRGLAREISGKYMGKDVRKQCKAAAVCCNLALGEQERTSIAVAKIAGPYLGTHLTSMSEELAVICAWALGNLLGAGPRAAELVTAQGALCRLVGALGSEGKTCGGGREDAALYAIGQALYQLREGGLSPELHEKLVSALMNSKSPDVWRPLFILSTHQNFKEIDHNLENVISAVYVSMETHIACKNNVLKQKVMCCEFTYIVRYLANICVKKETCDFVIERFLSDNKCVSLKTIFLKNDSDSAVLWFLGNLLNFASENDLKQVFFNNLCDLTEKDSIL